MSSAGPGVRGLRLGTRVALVGVAVLALTMVVVALLTYELVRVGGRQDVDRTLDEQRQRVVAALAELLPDAVAVAGGDVAAGAREAGQQALARNPGTPSQLTVLRLGGDALATGDGPAELVELRVAGELPVGTPGVVRTLDTGAGEVRVASGGIDVEGGRLGQVDVLGPLDDVQGNARQALALVGAAGTGGVLVGGLVLAVATRRALAPVGVLAGAARATGGEDLGARVPEPRRLDEVGVLAHDFNRMLERISADAAERDRLLAAVSHELRTPLAVASGHLELFTTLPAGDEAAARDLAATLQVELARLARIVDDLTALARGDLGARVEPAPLFLPDVLGALVDRLAGLGPRSGDVGVDVAGAAPVVVEADDARLGQVLLNLVANATTHTPPGTPVTVAARQEGATAVLEVVDAGPGIDPDVLDQVFDPFVTTRTAGRTRTSGLGLPVVRTLTEAMGGTVELRSTPAGTTATVRLPLAIA